ncbi:MAG: response regulator transcription factor [Magnetospirillum sp.]|nr:MAG: response regulator transcription factor [Magnetospirillum sp.]
MRVLVVEDEPALALRLQQVLEAAGFAVDVAYDGEEGGHLGDTEPYDAVVLDLGLPKIDGVTVLQRWREAGRAMPVVILTARGRWSEKMAGFNAGADDYMTKPFEMEEVVYRLRALIRRASGHAQPELVCGTVRLDTNGGRVTVDGIPVQMTAQEFRILSYFMHHRGRVVSRTELMEHVYDRHFDSDSNVLEVMLGRIRKKVGADLIQTVRGQGYRLAEPPEP